MNNFHKISQEQLTTGAVDSKEDVYVSLTRFWLELKLRHYINPALNNRIYNTFDRPFVYIPGHWGASTYSLSSPAFHAAQHTVRRVFKNA